MNRIAIALAFLLACAGSGFAQSPDDCWDKRPSDRSVAPKVVHYGRDRALKHGDVFVPRELRIRNSNDNCVFCAAEDCFWGAAGLDTFKGIKGRAESAGWHGASVKNVIAYAKMVKVPVASQVHGRDKEILHKSVKNGTGCYIEIPGHAIWLCGIDDDETAVRVVDNNGDLAVQEWPMSYFDQVWEGTACYPTMVHKWARCKWLEDGGFSYLRKDDYTLGVWNPKTKTWWACDLGDSPNYHKATPPWEEKEGPFGIFPLRRPCPSCIRPFRPRPSPGPSPDAPPPNPDKPTEPVKPDITPPPDANVPPKPDAPPVVQVPPGIGQKELDAMKAELTALIKSIPSGPQGPAGKDGKAGPAGPQGPAGKDVDPAKLVALQSQIDALKNQKFQAILLDAAGNVKQVAEFGPGVPLRLRLVPVTAPGPSQ